MGGRDPSVEGREGRGGRWGRGGGPPGMVLVVEIGGEERKGGRGCVEKAKRKGQQAKNCPKGRGVDDKFCQRKTNR